MVRLLSEKQNVDPTFKITHTTKGIELNCCWDTQEVFDEKPEAPFLAPVWPGLQNPALRNPFYNPMLNHPLQRLMIMQQLMNQQINHNLNQPVHSHSQPVRKKFC